MSRFTGPESIMFNLSPQVWKCLSQTKSPSVIIHISSLLGSGASGDVLSDHPSFLDVNVYSFLGNWLTLRVVLQASHQSDTALSAENLARGGPSTFMSRRSDRVLDLRWVLFFVLITFIVENILSTWPLEKGILKSSSQR